MTLPWIVSGYVSYLLCSICGAGVIEMFETKNTFWGVKMEKPLILGQTDITIGFVALMFPIQCVTFVEL